MRAYGISALACCSLLQFYLRHVLHRMSTAWVFSGALLCLYSLLFVILQAEDFAQLMGTLLVFALLAALMISTRKLNWYEIAKISKTDLKRPRLHAKKRGASAPLFPDISA
ncbi:inner membrane CreD family protein [Ketobacter sp.]|uniref:inner membrane CreD family protein n=1 Tax=Ketobacter sp. TaxID=2083498 RepID=UPI00398303B1